MKICMVVHAYYPHDESRVQREAKALVSKGHKVDIICLRKGKELKTGTADGVNFYRLPVKRHKNPTNLIYLFEYCSFFFLVSLKLTFLYFKKNYRVIHFHNPPDILVLTAIISKLWGAKIVLDIHDLMPELYASKSNVKMTHPMIKTLILCEKLACKSTDNVFTVTDIWRNRLIERGVPPAKCKVLMNLPDETVFKPSHPVILPPNSPSQKGWSRKGGNRVVLSEQGITLPTSPVILSPSPVIASRRRSNLITTFNLVYHGTMVKRYGIDVAIRAINIVKDAIPNVKLNVIGEGEFLDELLKLANTLGLQENVYFNKKFVPVNELPLILSNMDIGIVPNRNDCFTKEVLNAKLLEYIAMGLPVIAAKTAGVKYYFDDSMLLFFTPEDEKELAQKIIWAYNNQSQLQQFVSNAGKFLTEHNWSKEKTKLLSILA